MTIKKLSYKKTRVAVEIINNHKEILQENWKEYKLS